MNKLRVTALCILGGRRCQRVQAKPEPCGGEVEGVAGATKKKKKKYDKHMRSGGHLKVDGVPLVA